MDTRPTAVVRKLELDNTMGLGWGRMRVCRPGRQPRGHRVDTSGGLGGSVTQGSRQPVHESGQWSCDVCMLDGGQALQGAMGLLVQPKARGHVRSGPPRLTSRVFRHPHPWVSSWGVSLVHRDSELELV